MTKHSFKATVQSENSPTDFSGTAHVEKTPHAGCVFKKHILYLIRFSSIQFFNIYLHFFVNDVLNIMDARTQKLRKCWRVLFALLANGS